MILRNPFDRDDKAGTVYVDDESGLFNVSGCASDVDWFPGIKNQPEFYIKVDHICNSDNSDTHHVKLVFPVFEVFTPNTYDYHVKNPINLN